MKELASEGFDIVVSCANIEKMDQAISNDSVGKYYYYIYEKIKEIKGIDGLEKLANFIQWFWMHYLLISVSNLKKVFKLMIPAVIYTLILIIFN